MYGTSQTAGRSQPESPPTVEVPSMRRLTHLSLVSSLFSSLHLSRLSTFIFSCLLVLCRLLLSSLVCLSFSVYLSLSSFSVSLSLSSFSVSLSLSDSLSLSPCDVVCCVVWCVWCGVLCCVVWCVCVCLCVLWHVAKKVENQYLASKAPPCVHSKRLRVCRHHAHMC